MKARAPQLLLALLLLAGLAVRLRISRDWTFAGGDSYGYIKVAEELRQHGRYALGPPPEPLYYGRPPGYPLWLAALLHGDEVEWYRHASDNWHRIQYAQALLEILTLPLILFAVLRRRCGPWLALVGAAGALFWPLGLVLSSIVMTELLATILTTGALALLLVNYDNDKLWRFAAAGALAGAAFLVRCDSLLLAGAFAAALLFVAGGWRPRLYAAAWALAGFVAVVSPWAVRNCVRFGAPHLLVVGLDHDQRPTSSAFRDWMSTWAVDAHELAVYEYCYNRTDACFQLAEFYPPRAFASLDEQGRVGELLDLHRLRREPGRVDRGFARLASQRRRNAPWRTCVVLPLRRLAKMWSTPDAILTKADQRPWPALFDKITPFFGALSIGFSIAFVAALARLLARRETRPWGAIVGSAVVLRALVLAFFYFPEPRYLYEIQPAAGLVIVLALATLVRRRAAA